MSHECHEMSLNHKKLEFEDIILYESVFANSNELQTNLVDWILDDISVEQNDKKENFIWGRGPLNDQIGLPHRKWNCVKGGM